MEDKKIAILIDAENISSKYYKNISENVAIYGRATITRAYADWTAKNMDSWKKIIEKYAITPIHEPKSIKGKNNADIALIIDAMDIMASKRVDIICIASSDSDFTKLVLRLKEEGLDVFGYGEDKTPLKFRKAFTKFIKISNIVNDVNVDKESKKIDPSNSDKTDKRTEENNIGEGSVEATINEEEIVSDVSIYDLQKFIDGVMESSNEDISSGYNLGRLAQIVLNQYPDFDHKNYGKNQFVKLFGDDCIKGYEVKNNKLFRIEKEETKKANKVRKTTKTSKATKSKKTDKEIKKQ